MRRHTYRRVIFPLTAAFVIVACNSASNDKDNDSQQQIETFAEHMHGHLVHVDAIKTEVIAGNLDATREHSVWLSEHDEPPGMPDAWSPYVKEMRQYAAIAASARDLERVAVAVSEIARTCGECHRTNGANPEFAAGQRPPQELHDIKTEMHRHLWAANRMWESMIIPSDDAWKSATSMLAEVHLDTAQLTEDPANAARVEELLERARALGELGAATSAGPLRSEQLGKFLSLCARCHTLTGGGPARRN
jgi:mono/diheme cytochrome c family protein